MTFNVGLLIVYKPPPPPGGVPAHVFMETALISVGGEVLQVCFRDVWFIDRAAPYLGFWSRRNATSTESICKYWTGIVGFNQL